MIPQRFVTEYLNENGREIPGERLRYLAFLSEQKSGSGHHIVISEEESFLTLLRSWIAWVQTFPPQTELVFAEAAE